MYMSCIFFWFKEVVPTMLEILTPVYVSMEIVSLLNAKAISKDLNGKKQSSLSALMWLLEDWISPDYLSVRCFCSNCNEFITYIYIITYFRPLIN